MIVPYIPQAKDLWVFTELNIKEREFKENKKKKGQKWMLL